MDGALASKVDIVAGKRSHDMVRTQSLIGQLDVFVSLEMNKISISIKIFETERMLKIRR
jgi:hypothetical protein